MPAGISSYSTAYHVGQFIGVAVVLVLAGAVVRRAVTHGFGRRADRSRDLAVAVLAVVVAGVLVGSAVDDGLFESKASASAWSTAKGVEVRAGFMAGCSHGRQGAAATCDCVFQRVTSVPGYTTPEAFESLVPAVRRATETHRSGDLPAALVSAVRSCAPTRHARATAAS